MSDNYPTVGSTEEDYRFSGTAAVPNGTAFATGTTGDTSATGGGSTTSDTSKAASTAEAAKEQAGHLKDKATDASQKVAGTAKEEATKVASEVKTQAKDLFTQTKSELTEQAGAQQKRVASGLHSISDELTGMASNSSQGGVASDLVGQAASRAGSIATWLEARDPGSVLDEVRSFARQRPGTFIAIAAVAGVLAGRLTRSVVSASADAAKEAAQNGPTENIPTQNRANQSSATQSSATQSSYTAGYAGLDNTSDYSSAPIATPIHDALSTNGTPSGNSTSTNGEYR